MKVPTFIFVVLVLFSGCTTVQKGAATGAVAGGAVGGIIGHQSGRASEGALIGAGVGAVGGALIGEQMDTQFCPLCGRRFTSSVKYCPSDGTELQPIKR